MHIQHKKFLSYIRKFHAKKITDEQKALAEKSFSQLCWLAGFLHAGKSRADSLQEIAAYFFISTRRAHDWLNDDSAPPMARLMLFYRLCGLPLTGDFAGFTIKNGVMITPNNQPVWPEEIVKFPAYRATIRDLTTSR